MIDAGFFELNVTADHLDDVDARKKVLDKGRRDHAVSLTKRLTT